MDIAAPTPAAPTLTLSPAALAAAWRVGQRLEALVTALNGADRITLRIGNATVEAQTSLAAAAGQRLHLEVARNDAQIVLRIVAPPPANEPLAAALRAALPRQLPLQTVLEQFAQIAAAPPADLPSAGAAALKQLLLNLPAGEEIDSADTLRQALADSGPFLERKLLPDSGPPSLDKDLKANLLRLLDALNRGGAGSADLGRHVEAGLARVQLHQLSMLAEEQDSAPVWAGELPVRRGEQIEVWQFRIERDAHRAQNAEQQAWSTWLSFNLEALGPLHAKITLANKNVSATLWAESGATAELVNRHLHVLQNSLDGAGLTVTGLQCLQGRPALPGADRIFQGLLDLSA